MGMFGSLVAAPRKKKKNPWEYDTIDAVQEAAWGFPEKEEPETAKPQSDRWIDGGKFTAKDAFGIALTSVGDALSRQSGGQGDTLSSYMGRAQSARANARKAQADAAAQQRKIELAQRVNGWDADQAEGFEAGVWKPTEKKMQYVDDNVGNRWQVDPETGERKRIFTDDTPKYYIQGDQAIQIQNPYTQGGQVGPAPQAAPQPSGPTFTPEQYRGLVNGLGAQGAAAYMKRNGASVGGRTVKRTGMANGRKVVEYTDGTIEYAD